MSKKVLLGLMGLSFVFSLAAEAGRSCRGRGHGRVCKNQGCASEVQEANASVAVKTLKALSETTDFKDATKLKSVVGNLEKMTDANAKVSALLSLVKVNPEDSAAVYDFVYGRSVSQYVGSASVNLELDPKQTEIVLEALQANLKLNK